MPSENKITAGQINIRKRTEGLKQQLTCKIKIEALTALEN
jgi:hypothetical protein